jgi:type III pantothenate kinase
MPDRESRKRRMRRPAPSQPARTPAAPSSSARAARRSRAHARVLAVDVGNSETTLGLFHGDEVAGFWRLSSGRQTADEVALTARALLETAVAPRPDGSVLCSVVPALTPAWLAALARVAGGTPLEVNATTAKELVIRYHDRNAVGADRIANAIAVRSLYGTPAIVVDLGTATTFDCIGRAGDYLGGIIAPGVGTSAEELFRRAARLARVELRRPAHALGRSTEESLQAGVLWGHAGQVDALVRRLTLEMEGTPHVIATGGWAAIIAPECETVNRIDEALTLKGMRLLWERAR